MRVMVYVCHNGNTVISSVFLDHDNSWYLLETFIGFDAAHECALFADLIRNRIECGDMPLIED